MSLAYIVHIANYSDGVVYVLSVLLLVALAVLIDRFWSLRNTILRGKSVIRAASEMPVLREAELATLLKASKGLPEAVIIGTTLRCQGVASQEALAGHLDEAIMLIAPTLDRRLWLLDTIVTMAPLLGLFGTILGMFHAFNVLATPGHAPTEVTGGVAVALVATAFGIFIAVLGLVGFNALSNQVRLVVHHLDLLKMMIVNRVDADLVYPVPRAVNTHSVTQFATA